MSYDDYEAEEAKLEAKVRKIVKNDDLVDALMQDYDLEDIPDKAKDFIGVYDSPGDYAQTVVEDVEPPDDWDEEEDGEWEPDWDEIAYELTYGRVPVTYIEYGPDTYVFKD